MTEGFAGVYRADGLPDPLHDSQFYDGIPARRLVAWLIDTLLIGLTAVVVSIFTLGILFWIFPLVMTVTGFVYRWIALGRHSATPGMRLAGIEYRDRNGEKFGDSLSLAHTALFIICFTSLFGQILSIAAVLMTSRHQSLPDLLLGSAAINRPV